MENNELVPRPKSKMKLINSLMHSKKILIRMLILCAAVFLSNKCAHAQSGLFLKVRGNLDPIILLPYSKNHNRFDHDSNRDYSSILHKFGIEGSIGWRIFELGLSNDIVDFKDVDPLAQPYYLRKLRFKNYHFGVNIPIERINLKIKAIYSILADDHTRFRFIGTHPVSTGQLKKYNGFGLGLEGDFTIIGGLSVGLKWDCIKYKGFEDDIMYRYNPFIQYKFNF